MEEIDQDTLAWRAQKWQREVRETKFLHDRITSTQISIEIIWDMETKKSNIQAMEKQEAKKAKALQKIQFINYQYHILNNRGLESIYKEESLGYFITK